MIQNNNTKDVAYLGAIKGEDAPLYAWLIKESSMYKFPVRPDRHYNNGTIAVFDCSGTRYGFRIKELKSK